MGKAVLAGLIWVRATPDAQTGLSTIGGPDGRSAI
jgi:hypothetical protein